MRFSTSIQRLLVALLPVLLIGLSGCGDDSSDTPGDPAGDWLTASLENVTQGIRVDCPGVSGSVECGTATMTLAEDGTVTIVETTDETGAPADYRYEGIWRTQGNLLTIELREEGTDADNLAPTEAPDEVTGPYTLSSDTLTWSGEGDDGDTVRTTFDRI